MLNDEQLQQIRERIEARPLIVFEHMSDDERIRVRAAFGDRRALLAEVERLRVALEHEHEDRTREYEFSNADAERDAKRIRELIAKNAAMREIVQAVSAYGYDTGGECAFCSKGILHAPDCPVTKARAILSQPE